MTGLLVASDKARGHYAKTNGEKGRKGVVKEKIQRSGEKHQRRQKQKRIKM